MNILGLYGAFGYDPNEQDYCHEAGATLLKDGIHIASISEERLSKVKYDGRSPILAIEYCLNAGNLSPEDIDFVYVCDTGSEWLNVNWPLLREDFIDNVFTNADVKLLNHHRCHAAASVFTSKYNEGTFITLDGSGSFMLQIEGNTGFNAGFEKSTIGYFNKEKKQFRIFQSHPWSNEFGVYYLRWAHHTYVKKTGKEIDYFDPKYRDTFCGKIMGLAAYGKPQLERIDFTAKELSTPEVAMLSNPNSETSNPKEIIELNADDTAYFIQKNFENGLVAYLKLLHDEGYLEDNLCLSGGVFLNILANTEIIKAGIAKEVYIPPFPSDCGLHLGAACWGAYLHDETITFPKNLATLGVEYSDEEIKSVLDRDDIEYQRYDSFEDLCDEVSKDLRDNKIVGWFQNKSEHGPRALGSRSLLMNAQPKENKDILNSKVKHREYWRPFAGIILEDYVEEYFEEGFKSPYMLYSQTIKKEKINNIEAICHEDQTCRIQTVNKDLHPQVNSLLEAYLKLTNSPVILNTSFNDNGQPIVETPKDAIETFLNLQVDTLAIGNYVVRKINQ